MTERERLFITSVPDDRITEDELRAIETLEVWKRSYPRDYRAPNALACCTAAWVSINARSKRAPRRCAATRPTRFRYSNLAYAYRGMNRYDEAKRIANEAVAHKFETLPTRRLLYQLDMIAGHDAEAATQLNGRRQSARVFNLIGAEAQVAAYRGRMTLARDLYTQTIEMAVKGGFNEVASGTRCNTRGPKRSSGTPTRRERSSIRTCAHRSRRYHAPERRRFWRWPGSRIRQKPSSGPSRGRARRRR